MWSTISAEYNPFRSRGKLVLTVFASLGLGNLAAAIVFIVLLAAFRGAVTTNADHLEWAWSLLLGVTNFKSCQFRKLS
jgi:PHS family inorganic phosphate transporter-like MFS transporter